MSLATEIIADSPRVYWKLNDPRGSTTCADSSGRSHPGTVSSGVRMGSLGFGFAAGGAANVPYSGGGNSIGVAAHADFNVGDTFTIEWYFWIPKNFASVATVMTCQPDPFPHPYVDFVQVGSTQLIRLSQYGVQEVVRAVEGITDTWQWHSCMITKSGSTVKLYMDRRDVTGAVSNVTFPTGNIPIQILPDNGQGSMCHFAFYNTALSLSRMQAHHDAFVLENIPVPNPSIKIGAHTDSTYFGANGFIDSQVRAAKSIHCQFTRSSIVQDKVQSSLGGPYTWTLWDEYVKESNTQGMDILWAFISSPTFETGGGDRMAIPGVGVDATFQTWVTNRSNFLTDFLNRYKPGGSGPYNLQSGRVMIEIWNEPNLNGFFNHMSANTDQQWADQYAYLYKTLRGTIRGIVPDAKVSFGVLSSWAAQGVGDMQGEDFFRKVVGSSQWTGANAVIDYMDHHPYDGNNTPNGTTGFENHMNDPLDIANVCIELLGTLPRFWLTEWGFNNATSRADQALKCQVGLQRQVYQWPFVDLTSWWALDEPTFGLFNGLPNDGTVGNVSVPAAANYSSTASVFDTAASKRPPRFTAKRAVGGGIL